MSCLCEFYQTKPIGNVCIFFSPGFEFNCLNKKWGEKMCFWNGIPFLRPAGFFLLDMGVIYAAIEKGEL